MVIRGFWKKMIAIWLLMLLTLLMSAFQLPFLV